MPQAGFEREIPAVEWHQAHALDCMVTGIDNISIYKIIMCLFCVALKSGLSQQGESVE
jgi:hypothetical protein